VTAIFLGVAAGTLAPDANGKIYPQRSIARVKIGMGKAQVKARHGRPPLVSGRAPYTKFYYVGLQVTFHRSLGVVLVATTRTTERTRRRVGIGSTEKKVRNRVPRVVCADYLSVARRCRVGSGAPTTRVTDFFLFNGRVYDINLARVPDTSPPTQPDGLVVTAATKTSIALAWQPSSDDVGVTRYGLYRNWIRIGTTTGTSAIFGGLACGASYRLGVDASDAAGNRSFPKTLTANTQACADLGERLVAPGGSDGNPCTQAAPCRSFDRAYRSANPGDVVDVAPGSYPGQEIYRAAKGSADDITFRAVGDVVLGSLKVHASNVEFRGISTGRVQVAPSPLGSSFVPTDVTLRDMKAKGFDIMSSSNVSVIGGDFGPAGDYGSHVTSCASCKQGSRNIVIDGARIHDVVKVTPGKHVDCLHVWNTDTIVIQNSKFWNCEHFNILFTRTASHTGSTPRNITIQNNFFDCCRSGYYSVQFSGSHGELWRNVLVRNNSFNKAFYVGKGSTDRLSNVRIHSNVAPSLPFGVCNLRGTRIDYNVFAGGSRCGQHDVIGPSGFLDASGLDFHLAPGAPAIDRGHPNDHPLTDIDGNARPAGGAPDAGAHEHS
jgi:hypothetical protein